MLFKVFIWNFTNSVIVFISEDRLAVEHFKCHRSLMAQLVTVWRVLGCLCQYSSLRHWHWPTVRKHRLCPGLFCQFMPITKSKTEIVLMLVMINIIQKVKIFNLFSLFRLSMLWRENKKKRKKIKRKKTTTSEFSCINKLHNWIWKCNVYSFFSFFPHW